MIRYLIVPANYEYNDEGYDFTGYGEPGRLLYSNKDRAQEDMDKMLLKELRSMELNLYNESWADDEFLDAYNEVLNTDDDSRYSEEDIMEYNFVIGNLDDESMRKLVPYINLPLFKIIEVEDA
jgi:hypothetical protein